MRIVIVGAGALGSALGGALARGGADVTLVSRNEAHVDAIGRRGLILRTEFDGDPEDRVVQVDATTTCAGLDPADVVILLVKSHDTASAARQARSVVGAGTTVLTLQNGLGHEDAIATVLGSGRLVVGVTYVAGRLLEPGCVRVGLAGRRTVIGELDGSLTSRLTDLANTFTRCGVATEVTTAIEGIRWDKLLTNTATGALAAITGLPYGVLYDVPELERCALAAVAEGVAVAKTAGIPLTTSDPRAIWLGAAAGVPDDFRTSMLQSLDAGRRTEIDVINGAVVRRAASVGVATPVNETLIALVKGIEAALPRTNRTGGTP